MFSVGAVLCWIDRVWSSKNVRVVPVILVCIEVLFLWVLVMFEYVGSNLLI